MRRRTLTALAALPLAALTLTACAGTAEPEPDAAEIEVADEHEDDDDDHDDDDHEASTRSEVATQTPRIATTYDGGILILDGNTLELVADLEIDGFTRLNPFGTDRHLLVSATEGSNPGFRLLDVATWSQGHGDHDHYYVAEPELTDVIFSAEAPGHAIPHGGVTTLFDDATGEIVIFDPAEVEDTLPETRVLTSPAPHHGFAFVLDSGEIVATVGDEEARQGIRVLDAQGEELLRNEECPGVHGEGVLADEVVIAGCEDGVLLYRDGEITKVASPHEYGRIGNQYVTSTSSIALGDYKHDRDQGIGLHEVTLIDSETATLEVIHLPSGVEYTWRGLGRGPEDEGLVLGTDGSLHVLDVTTGKITASYPVIDAWEVPEAWQTAHPALRVLGETAYVTDPASQQIHAVDIPTGEVYRSADLPAAPNEIEVVTG